MIRDVQSLTTTQKVQNDSRTGMYHVITSNHSKSTTQNVLNLTPSSAENYTFASPVLGFEEKYRLEQKEFYKSYDPSVGYNTAAVLGGMLVFLLMYVVYRTKIRKHVLRLIRHVKEQYKLKYQKPELYKQQTEPMKYSFGNDQNQESGNDNPEASCEVPVKDPSEPTVPLQFVSFDSGTLSEHTLLNIKSPYALRNDKKKFIFEKQMSEDTQQLPIVVMDMQLATADWVSKQHQFLSPGGIILKVKSDTICPPNNEIYPSSSTCLSSRPQCCASSHHCLNAKRRFLLGAPLHHSLDLNNSMPFLEHNDSVPIPVRQSENQNIQPRRHIHLKNSKFPSVSSEPPKSPLIKCGKFPSLNSEPKSPLPSTVTAGYPRPRHTQQSNYQLNPCVPQHPVHITPIIKIQNYDKTQRKSSSTDVKESNESVSSSSSEDPHIYRISADKWNTPPTPHKRGVLKREDAITSSACQMCERTQALKPTQKQVSLDTGCQLRIPSPSPGKKSMRPPLLSTLSIPNMETPL